MTRFAAVLAIAVLVLAPLAAGAQAKGPRPSITVVGSGKVAAAPDTAQVRVGVTTVAETAVAALNANSAAMRKVFDALTERGIADRDRQTTTLNLYPVYERSDRQQEQPKITGYRAENGLAVTVRDIDKLGEVLDDLVTRGANQLQGISFSVAENEPLADQARRLAMADAARKAKLYAEEAGVALGSVIGIDERSAAVPQPRMFQAARAMAAESVPVAPGEQDFAVEVVVRYAIQ